MIHSAASLEKLSETVVSWLPEQLRRSWEALCARTIANVSPLQLCVVGEFAVGKSTLLNQLLGHDLIATDVGETTSLPIMLTYGAEAQAWHVDQQKNKRSIPLDSIRQYSERSGWDEEFLLVAWPATWLQGYFLIDLPGLGGIDSAKQAIAHRYLTLSDVVLYLLDGRGPKPSDIVVLKELIGAGKTVHLLVARWDQIEETVQSGQRAPDLEKWSCFLQEKTGQKIVPLPVSKKGHNLDLLRSQLQQVKEKRQEYRINLFLKQSKIILQETLIWFEKEIQIIEEDSTKNIQKKKDDLQSLRYQILEERAKVLKSREEAYPAIEQEMENITQEHRERLQKELEHYLQSFLQTTSEEREENRWKATQKEMHQALREVVSSFATASTQIDQTLAFSAEPKIVLTEGMVLSLPVRERVEVSELLDTAESSALQRQLEQVLKKLPTAIEATEGIEEKERTLEKIEQLQAELRREQHQIASMALPRVLEEAPGHRIGSTVGRLLGGIADIALLFVAPATAATKATSLLGQGAKAIGLSIHTANVANTLQQALSIHRATHLPQNPVLRSFLEQAPNTALPSKQAPPEDTPPQDGLLQKGANLLEKLSLSYWGEKLLSVFDQDPEYTEVVDPCAAAQQRAQYDGYQGHLLDLQKERQALQSDIDTHKDNQYAQKKLLQKKEELEKQINEMIQRQQAQQKIAEEHQEAQRKKALEGALRDLQLSLLSSFSSQAHGMKHHLFQVWKKHWQQIEQEAVEGHLAQLSTLEKDLELAPTERHNKHTETQHRKAQLQAALQQLTSPQPS